MVPESKKSFEAKLRKFKRELKKIADENNYPYVETLLDNVIVQIKTYPERKKIYEEKGYITTRS